MAWSRTAGPVGTGTGSRDVRSEPWAQRPSPGASWPRAQLCDQLLFYRLHSSALSTETPGVMETTWKNRVGMA